LIMPQGGRFVSRMAPSLVGVLGTMTSLRPIGRSFLFKNATSSLNNNGTVVGCQLNAGDHWLKYVNANPLGGSFPVADATYGYGSLTDLKQTAQLDAKTGMYMWAKPQTNKWCDWRNDFQVEGGVLMDTGYPIRDDSYQIMTCNISIGDSSLQSGVWTPADCYEAQTTDTTREQMFPTGNSADMLRLQDAVRYMVQYSENPLHFETIWNNVRSALSSVASGVQKYAPMVMDAAEMAAAFL